MTACPKPSTRRATRGALAGASAFLIALSAGPMRADPSPLASKRAPECDPRDASQALAIGASLVPGVVAHGAGHWVACQPETALRILTLEGVAVATTLVSVTALVTTGASRYVVAPLALGALGGVGLFTTSWLADIYGVAAPDGGTGRPRPSTPRLTIQTGLRAIHDPLFETPWLISHGFEVETGLIRVSPELEASPDARHRRYALLFERRLLGTHTDPRRHARWVLDSRLGLRDFSEKNEGFGSTTVEFALSGRMDLDLLGATLQGAFATAELGYAREWHRFDGLPGYTWDSLLGRVGFGAYLGRYGPVRGQSFIAYDHRRDTVAGGLHLPGIAAGYAGFVEHRSELYLGKNWGGALELAYGSAFVVSAYLLFRPAGDGS